MGRLLLRFDATGREAEPGAHHLVERFQYIVAICPAVG